MIPAYSFQKKLNEWVDQLLARTEAIVHKNAVSHENAEIK